MTHPRQSATAPRYVRQLQMDDLAGIEMFRDLKEETLSQICQAGAIRVMKPNARLHPTRDQVDHIYVILEGYLAIWRPSCFNPRDEYFLAWRGPNQIIGEMRAIGTEPTAARFQTCDRCKFIEIRNDTFRDVADSDPLIYRNIAELLMKKMRYQGHRSEVVQMSNPASQVAQTLLHLAEERCGTKSFNEQAVLAIPGFLHQREMGAYAGITRETVNRELGALRDKDIITLITSKSGCKITIMNRTVLQEIVQTPPSRSRKAKNRSVPQNLVSPAST
jgi:CRP/FNR family transcriptional regulator, cyclic AMP receptor protein